MILRKFNNIYPRTLWIAIVESEEDIQFLCKKFSILEITPEFNKILENAQNIMTNAYHYDVVAECRPVVQNSNYFNGILCIIYKPELVGSDILQPTNLFTSLTITLKLQVCTVKIFQLVVMKDMPTQLVGLLDVLLK